MLSGDLFTPFLAYPIASFASFAVQSFGVSISVRVSKSPSIRCHIYANMY